MICKNCGETIDAIYPMKQEDGYRHIADGELPDYQYCRKGGSWAEPATVLPTYRATPRQSLNVNQK